MLNGLLDQQSAGLKILSAREAAHKFYLFTQRVPVLYVIIVLHIRIRGNADPEPGSDSASRRIRIPEAKSL